ncbi:MAG: CBS domain-containing protein, partial [Candidatus Rokubacteria bacterium]|nr:CBS domain-containing protein [Candidatus Rokubacteria bacterium]
MANARVRDWMHVGVITCRPDTPAGEVADTLQAHDISALVVVDEEGYAVGVISRTDLVNATFVQPYLKHWRGLAARHLMSSPVVSVRADTSVEDAMRLIHDRKIHRVVVTEPEENRERPIGILSVTDLVG